MANLIPPIPNDRLEEGHPWREWFYHLGDYIQAAQVGLNPWTVAQGGTGSTSLNGYVKGNGTSPLTGQTGVPTSDITGTLAATTMPALTGDVTSTVNTVNTAISNTTVTGKVLTGFVSGAGTVAATDTILQAVNKLDGNVALKAPIASPTFTGTPAAPTATAGTNTTQLATTEFVTAAVATGSGGIVLATPQATTSGTSKDFTGIPSTVKRITVMLDGVSTNGTSILLVQLGAGSVVTSGYESIGSLPGVVTYPSTAGFSIVSGAASQVWSGMIILSQLTSGTWVGNGQFYNPVATAYHSFSAGHITSLGGTLDRVRLTTGNGTDTFDAGSVNISYE